MRNQEYSRFHQSPNATTKSSNVQNADLQNIIKDIEDNIQFQEIENDKEDKVYTPYSSLYNKEQKKDHDQDHHRQSQISSSEKREQVLDLSLSLNLKQDPQISGKNSSQHQYIQINSRNFNQRRVTSGNILRDINSLRD